jgi:phosphatidylglycerophosphatase A
VNWKLWIAQGFGIGRIPVAPGTFGSVLGLGFFALLLLTHSLPALIAAIVFGSAISIWLCGEGEKILKKRDPGSVVLDEIVAIPLCFVGWLILIGGKHLPAPAYFFTCQRLALTFGVFLLFRLFDVWKPWPVRQSQNLPGGWGVTVDDLLAAVYVNVVVVIIATIHSRLGTH